MPLTSAQERPFEVHRGQLIWRLRRADLGNHGGRLVRHYWARWGAARFSLLRYVWHPALFVFAVVRGHVDSIARGINVSNAQPDGQELANVNPIFTWVRLAQRIPVRVHIDQVPEGVVFSAGMTATVQIDPQPR